MTESLCHEVGELMQRYLDRDLDENDNNTMLTHLSECPECTELFARLVDLSSQLEMLPKVTPPVSIVDTILPRLQEMDAGAAVLTSKSIGERTKLPSRWRRWVSLPLTGGVIAAGLAVGFFLFQQQEGELSAPGSNTGGLYTASGSQEAANQAAPSSSAETTAKDRSIEQPAPLAAIPDETLHQGTGTEVAAKTTAQSDAPEQSLSGSPDTAAATIADRGKQAGIMSTSSDSAASAPQAPPAVSAPRAAENSNMGDIAASPVSPAPAAKQEQLNESMGIASIPTEDMKQKDHSGDAEFSIAGTMEEQPSMGITSAVPATDQKLTTEDGKYSAFVVAAEGKIVIRDQEDNVVFEQSVKWPVDSIKLISWSPDYMLTYQVMAADGGFAQFSVELDRQ